MFVFKKCNVTPRSRSITASNQDNFFHLIDSQSKLSGEGEPAIDMLHHPSAEVTLC
jgi:hypothetical protein